MLIKSILVVNAEEQERRVHEAVEHYAFQIFKNRGATTGHAREDWHQAELDLICPECSTQMQLDDTLWINASVAMFKEGTIEIWVAPHKLTICGEPAATNQSDRCSQAPMIFQKVDLACEVDVSRVHSKIVHGSVLEITLRTVQKDRGLTIAGAVKASDGGFWVRAKMLDPRAA